eukprot:767059-Hanusia_phi.AAC.3
MEAALEAIGYHDQGGESYTISRLERLNQTQIELILRDQCIQKKWRAWARVNHPDHGGDTTRFQEVSRGVDGAIKWLEERKVELQTKNFQSIRQSWELRKRHGEMLIKEAIRRKTTRLLRSWYEVAQSSRGNAQSADSKKWTDKDFVVREVKRKGMKIRMADPLLQSHPEVLRAAIGENGMCLKFATEDMRKDQEIVKKALQENGNALQFADEMLQSNDEMLWNAIQSKVGVQLSEQFVLKDEQDPMQHARALCCAVTRIQQYHLALAKNRGNGTREGLLTKTRPFRVLLDMCKKVSEPSGEIQLMEKPTMDDIKPFVENLLKSLSDSRRQLHEFQKGIRRYVMQLHTEEIGTLLKNRDLQRSRHCRLLRDAMCQIRKACGLEDLKNGDLASWRSSISTIVTRHSSLTTSIETAMIQAKANMECGQLENCMNADDDYLSRKQPNKRRNEVLRANVDAAEGCVLEWQAQIDSFEDAGAATNQSFESVIHTLQHCSSATSIEQLSGMPLNNLMAKVTSYCQALADEGALNKIKINHLRSFPVKATFTVTNNLLEELRDDFALLQVLYHAFEELFVEHENEYASLDSSGSIWKQKEQILKSLQTNRNVCQILKIDLDELKCKARRAEIESRYFCFI